MSNQYDNLFQKYGTQYGVDPKLLSSVAHAESNYNPRAGSSAGAQGLMQFMPGTFAAQHVGSNPYDPAQSVQAGAKYLSSLLHQFGGNTRLAVAGYNAGGGAARKAITAYPETRNYVSKVMGYYGGGNAGTGMPSNGAVSDSQPLSQLPFTHLSNAQQNRLAAPTTIGSSAWNDSGDNGIASQLNALYAQKNAAYSEAQQQAMQPGGGAGGYNDMVYRVPGSNVAGLGKFGSSQVAGWISPILNWAQQHGWKGQVTSGYRSAADQQRIIDTGANGSNPVAAAGHSNHQMTAFPGGAVDVSMAQQLSNLLMHSPYAGQLVYAGAKDPVHFSHPHNGSY